MEPALVKGTGIHYFHDFLTQTNANACQEFMERLSSTEQAGFKKVVPVSWIPIELASVFYSNCAAVLFPHDPMDLEKLASKVAKRDLGGIYKILLKVVSMNTMIQQAAKLWRVNHQKGVAKAWTVPDQKISVLEVAEYPELTQCYSRVTRGYLMGMTALSGTKNIEVKTEHPDPDSWRWTATWV